MKHSSFRAYDIRGIIGKDILIEDVYKAAAASFHINTDDLKEKIYSNFTTIFNTNGR